MKTSNTVAIILVLLFSAGCAIPGSRGGCKSADECVASEKVGVSPRTCRVGSNTSGSGSSTSGSSTGSASSNSGC